MATAVLYYRTTSTLSDNALYPNPSSDYTTFITNMPSTQVLEFDFPENILEGIKFSYQNNVINLPAPNNDGVKLINKQENGLRGVDLTINGVLRNPKTINADITTLKRMATLSQIDTKHIYGIVGFYSPNAPEFSLDPNATSSLNATKGYTLNSFTIGYVGQQTTRYDFRVELSFGGIYTS